MKTENSVSLESLLTIASGLTRKQEQLRTMLAMHSTPELLLELSKSLRDVSSVNRQIAVLVREKARQHRQAGVEQYAELEAVA